MSSGRVEGVLDGILLAVAHILAAIDIDVLDLDLGRFQVSAIQLVGDGIVARCLRPAGRRFEQRARNQLLEGCRVRIRAQRDEPSRSTHRVQFEATRP